MRPHYSHSSCENATPSSGTSLLASCKGVPPREKNRAPILRLLWSANSSKKKNGGRTLALFVYSSFRQLRPDKRNNRLLYAMMGLMFSAQMIMVYKHLKGKRVVCEYTLLFIKIKMKLNLLKPTGNAH